MEKGGNTESAGIPRTKRGRPRKVEKDPEATKSKQSKSHPSTSKSRSKTRDVPKKDVWVRIVGNISRDLIPAQRLPTNRVVMQRYSSMRKENIDSPYSLNEYANRLYKEILPIWENQTYHWLKRRFASSV